MLLAADRERRPSAAQLDQALNSGPYLRAVPRPTRTQLPPLPSLPVPITVPAGTGPAAEQPESALTGAAREQATRTTEKQDSTTSSNAGWIWVLVIAVIVLILIASNH